MGKKRDRFASIKHCDHGRWTARNDKNDRSQKRVCEVNSRHFVVGANLVVSASVSREQFFWRELNFLATQTQKKLLPTTNSIGKFVVFSI